MNARVTGLPMLLHFLILRFVFFLMLAVTVLVNVVQAKKEQRHNADVKQSVVICIVQEHDGIVSIVTIAYIVVSQSINYIYGNSPVRQ